MNTDNHTKWFNYGYFLSQYEPKLLDTLLSTIEGKSEYYETLVAGKEEYQAEAHQNQVNEMLEMEQQAIDMELDMNTETDMGMEPDL